ncbi:CPBP family intramembrane glutamic endopeptidase [Nocardioides insulae]|uniref:CPBP family intramembrane glutamic endopeptidase n=1 Tax=Nocardioides insulae TaxID=394734 RepID=UPI0003FBAD13|nr:type II CAAX endopeptidase family protein [Nocardioides insulae]
MTTTATGGSGFWGRPTLWKAVLFVLAYLVFYLVVGWIVDAVFDGPINEDDILADFLSIFFGLVLPIVIGGAAIAFFAARQGWLSEIFRAQPVRGRRWMWIGPILAATAIVGHMFGTDWGAWGTGQLLAMVLLGASVGFTEELATRGVVVKMMRDAHHGEKFVALISSLLFALMHMTNLISGMEPSTVAATVVYTFGFGMCMYMAMRVTGTIWAAIILHALTDPTTFLASGGLDKAVTDQSSGASVLAVTATVLIVIVGFVSVFFVRGRASGPAVPADA